MTITRTTVGKLAVDDFAVDSSSLYNQTALPSTGGMTRFVIANDILTMNDVVGIRNDTGAFVGCVSADISNDSQADGANSAGVVWSIDETVPSKALQNLYFLRQNGGYWQLYSFLNGSATLLTSSPPGLSGLGTWGKVRLYRDGATLHGRAGGTDLSAVDLTSADATHSPAYGGLRYSSGSRLAHGDNLWLSTSHIVVFSGLEPGYYLLAADSLSGQKKVQESGGTATLDAGALWFPLVSIGVYDGDPDGGGSLVEAVTSATYSDMGGGDTYIYSTGGGPTPPGMLIPQIVVPQYYPQFGGLTYG